MNIEFENISRVTEAYTPEMVNKYLDIGWVLIHISPSQDRPIYVLGWDKAKGEVQELPKTKSQYNIQF